MTDTRPVDRIYEQLEKNAEVPLDCAYVIASTPEMYDKCEALGIPVRLRAHEEEES